MSPTSRENADAQTIRRERYEAVLAVADANTTDEQPPGVGPENLRRLAMSHAGFKRTDEERQGTPSAPPTDELTICLNTVRAAVENGDLFRWDDTHANVTRYTPVTVSNLQAIVAYENARDEPDTRTIERVVERLKEVRG